MRAGFVIRTTIAALCFLAPSAVSAQDALKDRVEQLLEKLASDDEASSQAAQDALLKLGPRVLPLLPEPDKNGKLTKRLSALRESLERSGTMSTDASKVTISGESLRLSDVMRSLQRQSGNTLIDLREQSGQTASNPSIALDIKDKPFFVALDEIALKTGLSLNFYNAEGAIAYLEGMEATGANADAGKARPSFVEYVNAFRVSLNQIVVSREFAADTRTANLRMELVWEPRLRPLAMKLDTGKIEAVDDKGRKLSPSVAGESMELGIRPENPIVDVNLNLTAPERDALMISSLTVECQMTIPTAKRTLRTPDITKKDAVADAGKASLKILDFNADPPVWRVRAELTSPPPAGAQNVDSYRESGLAPVVALVKADSARIPLNGGFSVGPGSGPGKLVYEFLFVDVNGRPEDHGLVIEIPDELKTVPLRWSFKNIPLP
jgi:hypothetical protein